MSQRETRSTKKPAVSVPTKATSSKKPAARRGSPTQASSSKHDASEPKPLPSKNAASSAKPPSGKGGSTGATPLTYQQSLKLMKDVLKVQRPDLAPKELDVMARSMVAAANKKGKAEKDRWDTIQANSAAMIDEEHEGNIDMLGESGQDGGESTGEGSEVAVRRKTKGKAKEGASSSKSRPTAKPRKRKAIDSEKESSDDESAAEPANKKKPKTNTVEIDSPEAAEPEEGDTIVLRQPAAEKDEIEEPRGARARKQGQSISNEEKALTDRLGATTRRAKPVGPVRSVLQGGSREGVLKRKGGRFNVPLSDAEDPVGSPQPSGEIDSASAGEPPATVSKVKDGASGSLDDGSGDDSSSYQPEVEEHEDASDEDQLDELDGADDLIIQTIDNADSKNKGKAKVQKTSTRTKDVTSTQLQDVKDVKDVKELFVKEPVKSFLHKAMQELRVYIALENAWPRLKGTSMEKLTIPINIMNDLQILQKYQTDEFQKDFAPLWSDEKIQAKMGRYVYRAAAQIRQELKQKAKRVVEKELLSIKISDTGLDVVSRTAKLQKAKEARIRFLKQNNTFHYGNVELPDPGVDPSLANLQQLWETPDLDTPFHSIVIAEVMARQWWVGQHPEALRSENRERFDLDVMPPSSNMIALTCSAILVALDESLKGNSTVAFEEKTYAAEFDRLFAGIEKLRRHADPNSRAYNEGVAALVESLNDTLVTNIRAFAGIAQSSAPKQTGKSVDVDDGIDLGLVIGRWSKGKAAAATPTTASTAAADQEAGPSTQRNPPTATKGKKA
ncbi:uncharacterized protein B0H18DRAFT_953861 [Fomitopsis serialis]|uniref:uncharacterized protein n=1 Tax=Fomitopsis serialis TaxID=139415 RepID=UPI002007A1C6|nr:uncharacterized protein B0H18DRAFT_953861 [Neoantrodia serialis]KAH9928610.1 hypothetical protein B0H18DRAFT_953861 [Neoantrodia serialis]